ncbi:hypothetical protein B0H14DRAFT_2343996, partial [Mycena olivaceomarginata]
VECDQCARTFVSDAALHNHCVNKADHPYCESCEILFGDENALRQANAAAHQVELQQVADRLPVDRPYCQTCDRNFKDGHALQQAGFCEPCNRQFPDWDAICQHLAASSRHDWCFACWKDLPSRGSLKKHCASVHTRSGKRTECPLCDEKFDNPAAIALHITQGICCPIHILYSSPQYRIHIQVAHNQGGCLGYAWVCIGSAKSLWIFVTRFLLMKCNAFRTGFSSGR